MRIRSDDAVLVEQGQLALRFQDALDHEHHVGAPRVIFVEDQGRGGLQRPGKQTFSKFGDLLPVPEDDRVAADEVDAADMRVEVDADRSEERRVGKGGVSTCRSGWSAYN